MPTKTDLDRLMRRFLGREEELIDAFTLREIELVMRRALYGWTFAELHGYLGYRKRQARGEDKVKSRRIIKALRTDLWGLRGAVVEAYRTAERERRFEGADRLHAESVAETNARIPDNKRGHSENTRKRTKSTRKARPDPEGDERLVAKHNEYVRAKAGLE